MKKILFSVAILAVAVSCSKNEVSEVVSQYEISFSNLNDRVTKTANDAGDDYKVYAKHSGATADWYINDAIDATSNEGSKTYLWPTDNATIDFYSYAPAVPTGNLVVSDATVGTLGLTYTVPADAQEDFTLAAPLTAQVATTNSATAAFTFSHILSKISVVVNLTDELKDGGYSIEGTPDAAISVFENQTAINAITAESTPGTSSTTLTTYDKDATATYYVMPQDVENCELQIQGLKVKRTLGTAPNTEDIYLFGSATAGVDMENIVFAAGDITDGKFVAGKHYTLTVTVGSSSTTEDGDTPLVILFSAAQTPWTTGTGALDQD